MSIENIDRTESQSPVDPLKGAVPYVNPDGEGYKNFQESWGYQIAIMYYHNLEIPISPYQFNHDGVFSIAVSNDEAQTQIHGYQYGTRVEVDTTEGNIIIFLDNKTLKRTGRESAYPLILSKGKNSNEPLDSESMERYLHVFGNNIKGDVRGLSTAHQREEDRREFRNL